MTHHIDPRPESLEPRRLFASAFENINVSRTPGNHAEGTIVVDPTDPDRMFAASNAPGTGLLASVSDDGGDTWSSRMIATGDPGLSIAAACCDPSAAFDRFGNLYLTYARDADHGVDVVRSTNAGATFVTVASFDGDLDQPTVTSKGDSIWVTFKRGNSVAAAGAALSGLGTSVTFAAPANLPGSRRGNFGDIEIGWRGQVAVTYQQGTRLSVNVDPDGLGPAPFGRRVLVAATKVSGFDRIAAQLPRGIDAEADLVYASAESPAPGRLYLLYTDEQPDGSDNMDLMLRLSPDDGATWSAPVRVNSDTGLATQFLPRMAIDGPTGELYFAWYDTRNDAGAGSPGDSNGAPNDDAELFAARARPTPDGLTLGADAPVSQGSSNAVAADSSVDLGDYIGLAYHGGTLYPLWADNSNTTRDNPDGAGNSLDQYTARVPVASLPVPTRQAVATTPPQFQYAYSPGRAAALAGKPEYRFRVTYVSPVVGIDPATIDDDDILVTGPGGFSAGASPVSARRRRGGAVAATYRVAAPGGRWRAEHNGTYTVSVRPGQVLNTAGLGGAGGEIGTFAVRTSLA